MLTSFEADAAVVPLAHQRRRHHRTDLCFKVRFNILGDEEALRVLDHIDECPIARQAAGSDPDETYMQNVSSGGLGLCGQTSTLHGRSLEEGDFLKIEVQPLRAAASVRCVGRVAWVELNSDAGIFRAGVSFVAVHPGDLERLQPRLWSPEQTI